jgi:hypothetical protein
MLKKINILLITLSLQAKWRDREREREREKKEHHKLEYFFHIAALMAPVAYS